MKFRPAGPEFLHVDGRIDIEVDRYDEANSRLSKFSKSA
jgi:hypothetical protein